MIHIGQLQGNSAIDMRKHGETGIGRMPVAALLLIVCLLGVMPLMGCSSSNSNTVNGCSIEEYNADVDNLESLLSRARNLYHQIESMGTPNAYNEAAVDAYNEAVDEYNSVASKYTDAARSFNNKYGSGVDGIGTAPTNPDNIYLPKKK